MDVIRRISLATLRRRLMRKAEAGNVDAMMEYCSTYPDVELASASRDERGLLRDPGNAHDANAIAVVSPAGDRIGWIPRACNTAPAALLDRGIALSARITDLDAIAGEEAISLLLTTR